jgi:hypothetical protein
MMRPAPGKRGVLLALALAATLALTFGWQPPEPGESGVAEASVPERRAAREAARADAPELDLARLSRAPGDVPGGKALFGPHSWAPPPAPAPKRAGPPPKPAPPPLPFTYLGRMIEGGETRVFLAGGQHNHVVAVGDVIEETYRVDSIKDGVITLTYLPLQERQQLAIGSAE